MRARDLAPYGALALSVFAVLPVAWPIPHLGDLFLLWGVGRMTLDGLSPYDRSSWEAMAARYPGGIVDGAVNVIPNMAQLSGIVWPYPPWTAYVFVPFAALPPGIGTGALHLAYLAAGIAAAILLARLVPGRSSPLYGIALVAFALYQPFAMDVRAGQFATFLLLGIALVGWGIEHDRAPAIVAGALLLFLKPHLFSLFAIVVLVLLVRRRSWLAIAWTSAALALVAAITIALRPASLAVAFAGAADRAVVADRFATTWAVARALDPVRTIDLGLALVMASGAVVAAAVWWAPPRGRTSVLLYGSLVLSLVISPYVQAYDDIVLLPVVFLALAAVERPARAWWRGVQLAITVLAAVLYPWLAILLQMTSGTQASSGLIPILFAALLAASVGAATARGPARMITSGTGAAMPPGRAR